MHSLGFEKYVEPLRLFLAKYRESGKSEPKKSTMPTGSTIALQTVPLPLVGSCACVCTRAELS
jgi:hypothetical protein